jgi:hypothetical protein
MKIIKQPILYQCDICGFTHESKDLIEAHEASNKLPPCRFKIDDLVLTNVRGDAYRYARVKEIKITNTELPENIEYFISGIGHNYHHWHKWIISLTSDINVASDKVCVLHNQFNECDLILDSDLNWVEMQDALPQSSGIWVLIKYTICDDEVIRVYVSIAQYNAWKELDISEQKMLSWAKF